MKRKKGNQPRYEGKHRDAFLEGDSHGLQPTESDYEPEHGQELAQARGQEPSQGRGQEPSSARGHEHEAPAWAGEKAAERSRQQAMAAREKATRTKMSVGQSNVQRLKKGNQPRGG